MMIFFDIGIERRKDEALIECKSEYDQFKLKKGEIKPHDRLEFKITEGKKLFDIVGFQDTSNFAISHRLHNLLVDSKLTGWASYEISIEGRSENYYGFHVTGRCAQLDTPKESGFYTGYKFDYHSWDSSDFFSPQGSMLLFCTSRVQELFEKNQITNVEICNINEVRAYSIGT